MGIPFLRQAGRQADAHVVSWSDKNPFEFLTNSEMLIDQWYAAPKF